MSPRNTKTASEIRRQGVHRRPQRRPHALGGVGRDDDVEIVRAAQRQDVVAGRPGQVRVAAGDQQNPPRRGREGRVQGAGDQRATLERRQQLAGPGVLGKAASGSRRQDHGVDPRAFTFRHVVPRLSYLST